MNQDTGKMEEVPKKVLVIDDDTAGKFSELVSAFADQEKPNPIAEMSPRGVMKNPVRGNPDRTRTLTAAESEATPEEAMIESLETTGEVVQEMVKVSLVAQIVREIRLEEIIRTIDKAETALPVSDPSFYRKNAGIGRTNRRLVSALLDFKKVVEDVDAELGVES